MKKLISLSILLLALFSVSCSPKTEADDSTPTEPQAWEWRQVANFSGQAQRGAINSRINEMKTTVERKKQIC